MVPVLRILIGSVFLVSGAEKLLHPYQNFVYAIQAYQMLPSAMEGAVGRVLPWLELFVGLFTVLGLWTRLALKGILVLCAVFIVVVGQALLRGLPIDQCGCFGEWLHVSPRVIIIFDSAMLLATVYLLRHPSQTMPLSLDRYYK